MSRHYLGTAPVPARGPPFDLHGDLGSMAGRAIIFSPSHFELARAFLIMASYFLHEISVEVGTITPPIAADAIASHPRPSHRIRCHRIAVDAIASHPMPSHRIRCHRIAVDAIASHSMPSHRIRCHRIAVDAIASHPMPWHRIRCHCIASDAIPSHPMSSYRIGCHPGCPILDRFRHGHFPQQPRVPDPPQRHQPTSIYP